MSKVKGHRSNVTTRAWQVTGGLAAMQSLEDLRALLLRSRGLTGATTEAFFAPQYDRDIHDPLLFPQMEAALDRIFYAIKKEESIVIHGDYDADGITSTAILVSALQDLGAHVTPFLPHRSDDGYGVNKRTLEGLQSEMDLLITVDCGISNAAEISWLKGKGIDTIIVDHHEIPAEVPPALAIIHPAYPKNAYPWPYLCGAGTAWKLAAALLRDQRSPVHDDPDHAKWLLDLAAIGTLADVVSLLGENRAIVTFGLEVLRRTRRPGLQALLAAGRSPMNQLTSESIAFEVIPVLNAAGRLDHPQPALELLLTKDARKAGELLKTLKTINNQRRTLTKKIVSEATEQVNGDPVIFAYDSSWPAGIVGLAAGRLAERFGKPAIVVGSNGSSAVGSARAPAAVNVLNLLRQTEEILEKLGGHAQAAGFSLLETNINPFRLALQEAAHGALLESKEPVTTVEAVLAHGLVTTDAVRLIESFSPFGEGNKKPRFIVSDLTILDMRPVGKQGDHLKFTFDRLGEELDGIGFGIAEAVDPHLGDRVDVVAELDENEFRGRRRLQLLVREIVPAGSVQLIAGA